MKFDPDDYEIKQVFYTSKDGTKVPMFITHKKGLKLDGNNPTLLYGYGGFNISLTPGFSVSRLAWMEMGGVYAAANLRGGGEYGEEWHQAGTKLQEAERLRRLHRRGRVADRREVHVSRRSWRSRAAATAACWSARCMTQRPDLFGACLPAVGVMDMLRFHKFTAGRSWVDDYGSSDNPEEFKALYAYSPYHNLKPGTKYPADAGHHGRPRRPRGAGAQLQVRGRAAGRARPAPAPVLIRIETRAGHGAGKPTAKLIEEVADEWAFLVKNLKMDVK